MSRIQLYTNFIFCYVFVFIALGCAAQDKHGVKSEENYPSRSALFEKYHFDYVGRFENNRAIAMRDGETFLIDRHGKKIIDFPYDDDNMKSHGNDIMVKDGTKIKLVNTKDESVVSSGCENLHKIDKRGYYMATKNGEKGLYDMRKKHFYPIPNLPRFPHITCKGLLQLNKRSLNRTDFVDFNGTLIFSLPYSGVKELANGNFAVNNKGNSFVLDSKGQKILSKKYDRFKFVKGGFIIVTKDKKSGIINDYGAELLSPRYDRITDEDGYFIYHNSTSTGLIDDEMKVLCEFTDDCKNVICRPPYFICAKDTTSLVYNTDSLKTIEYPYKIGYTIAPDKYFFYKNGSSSGILNNDLSIKRSGGVHHRVLGLEVISAGTARSILLSDGSILNNEVYSKIKGLAMTNRLVLGDTVSNKVGLYSRTGEEILPMQYDDIKPLYRNYLLVRKDGQAGIVDQNGKFILEPIYNNVVDYLGVFIIHKTNGESFLMNKSFEVITSKKWNSIRKNVSPKNILILQNDSLQAIFDTNTRSIVEEGEWISRMSKPYLVKIQKDGLYGVMDLRYLKMVVNYQPLEYRRLKDDTDYSNKFVEVRDVDGEKSGVTTLEGEELISVSYSFIIWFNSEEQLLCARKGEKAGILNFKEEIVVPFLYDEIGVADGDQFVVKVGDKYGVVDRQGNVITPIIYSKIRGLGEGKRRMVIDGKWGFLDHEGSVFIDAKYDAIDPFESGLAIVRLDGLYGVINDKKELVIPHIYEKIGFRFYQGKAEKLAVRLKERNFMVDFEGRCLEQCPDEEFLQKYGIEKK